jgi:hypothetical protein
MKLDLLALALIFCEEALTQCHQKNCQHGIQDNLPIFAEHHQVPNQLDSQKILPIYFEPKLASKLLQKSSRGSHVFSCRQGDKLDIKANLYHDAMYFRSSNSVLKNFFEQTIGFNC